MNHSSWQIDSLLQTESVIPVHSAGSIPNVALKLPAFATVLDVAARGSSALC
jgi:hypothetical protein